MIALYQVMREQLPVADAWAAMQKHKFGSGHRVLRESLYGRAAAIAAPTTVAAEPGGHATAAP